MKSTYWGHILFLKDSRGSSALHEYLSRLMHYADDFWKCCVWAPVSLSLLCLTYAAHISVMKTNHTVNVQYIRPQRDEHSSFTHSMVSFFCWTQRRHHFHTMRANADRHRHLLLCFTEERKSWRWTMNYYTQISTRNVCYQPNMLI